VCELCGFEWRSESISFDTGGLAWNLDEKDVKLLWEAEHREYYDRMKTEAAIEFNKCPLCGTWVCDDCFFVDSGDVTDICVECIEESGSMMI
jgi:hypothetical protein